ncbi:NADH-quinone oxidoreductase subunit N [bacterium]|nr:NADH-quinone oxidoreductase subunit N [bacterium]
MTSAQIATLLPIIILSATVLGSLMTAAFVKKGGGLTAGLTIAGHLAALVALVPAAAASPQNVMGVFAGDAYYVFFAALVIAASAVVALLAHGYLAQTTQRPDELHILLTIATIGAVTLAGATHFATLFLGLEILTIALYAMIAYMRERPLSMEAGVKYLIVAGASGAFVLFGMALIYADTGEMGFAGVRGFLSGGATLAVTIGGAMIFAGAGYKLAVAPFHMWAPDVYEGAPAPVGAYVATVSKAAMFAVLLRLFSLARPEAFSTLWAGIGVIAVLSMFVGNLLALMQKNLKRLLAYSSIAHLGYLLVAFVAGGEGAMLAGGYYLVAYVVTNLAAFGVIGLASGPDRDRDAISDYRGLFWQRPLYATALTAAMLSLAGIPLTAGFLGKYFVLAAGVGAAQWALVFFLAFNSALGIYYYLRVVVAMFSAAPDGEEVVPAPRFALGAGIVAILAFVILWFGIFPAPLIRAITSTLSPLG